MNQPKLGLVLGVATIIVIWFQGRTAIWGSHLQVDVWILWERINYYFSHHNTFAGLLGNEYLPATLLYAFLPIGLIPSGWLSYSTFLPAMLLINMGILLLHLPMLKERSIFFLSLLFLGPILLFRFDGLVTLVMILAFRTFVQGNFKQSGFWLGIATGLKVFPAILLPYLMLILIKQKRSKNLVGLLIFFIFALLLPVFGYLLMGGTIQQISTALAFHSQKLISIESVPGSFITGWSLYTIGSPPPRIPGNGIWAVAGPAALFNRLWVMPVLAVYLYVLRKRSLLDKFSWQVPFFITLIFLIFSKNLNPQYLWWFMAMLPFVKPSKLMLSLTLLAALANQLVFPVYYTKFVENFFQLNQNHWVYYLLLLRNVLLIVVTYLSGRRLR